MSYSLCIVSFLGLPRWLSGKKSACNAGDPSLIPGSGRSPGEENGNPLQYSCLENPMDNRTWQRTVHGVAKSQTPLKRLKQQQTLCIISLLLLLCFFWKWGLYFRLVVIFQLITSVRPSGLWPYLGVCYFICQLWVPSLDADLFSLWELVSSPCFPHALPIPHCSVTVSTYKVYVHFLHPFPIFVL